jgi:hypothetical protein
MPLRIVAVLGTVGCVSLLAADEQPRTLDLVIVAGQSNAVGFDARPVELPEDASDRNVLGGRREILHPTNMIRTAAISGHTCSHSPWVIPSNHATIASTETSLNRKVASGRRSDSLANGSATTTVPWPLSRRRSAGPDWGAIGTLIPMTSRARAFAR